MIKDIASRVVPMMPTRETTTVILSWYGYQQLLALAYGADTLPMPNHWKTHYIVQAVVAFTTARALHTLVLRYQTKSTSLATTVATTRLRQHLPNEVD